MLTHEEAGECLQEVSFRGWTFHVGVMGDGFFLQVRFVEGGLHQGRKWYLSRHATRSELVQTALLAVLTAMEHEVREEFKYRGEAIFGPHHDVSALLGIAQEKRARQTA